MGYGSPWVRKDSGGSFRLNKKGVVSSRQRMMNVWSKRGDHDHLRQLDHLALRVSQTLKCDVDRASELDYLED